MTRAPMKFRVKCPACGHGSLALTALVAQQRNREHFARCKQAAELRRRSRGEQLPLFTTEGRAHA